MSPEQERAINEARIGTLRELRKIGRKGAPDAAYKAAAATIADQLRLLWEGAAPEPCLCSRCEQERFEGWRDRVKKIPKKFDHRKGSPAMELINELHSSIAIRFPLGIAERLYQAITSIHIDDRDDAWEALNTCAEDERGSIEANPDEARFFCDRWKTAAPAARHEEEE